MCHTDIRTTMNIYGKAMEKSKREARLDFRLSWQETVIASVQGARELPSGVSTIFLA